MHIVTATTNAPVLVDHVHMLGPHMRLDDREHFPCLGRAGARHVRVRCGLGAAKRVAECHNRALGMGYQCAHDCPEHTVLCIVVGMPRGVGNGLQSKNHWQ